MEDLSHPMYQRVPIQEAEAVAWVVPHKQAHQLVMFPFKFSPLGSHEVRLKVLHSSCCYSDVMHARQRWKSQQYPLCLGHESVGEVVFVGSEVKTVKEKDIVGVTPIRSTDNTCKYCIGKENKQHLCENRHYLYGKHFGGYCTHLQTDHRWVFKIPHKMIKNVSELAPLFCAGITSYTALKKYLVPGGKCAIMGIGGLGHMALQFANKMGMKTTAFTSKTDFKEEIQSMGAINIQSSINQEELKQNAGKFDVVFSSLYIGDPKIQILHQRLAKSQGVFIACGTPSFKEGYCIDLTSIFDNEAIVVGSSLGSTSDVREMLEFASQFDVLPCSQHFDFAETDKAFHQLENNSQRFKIIIDIQGWAKKNGFDR